MKPGIVTKPDVVKPGVVKPGVVTKPGVVKPGVVKPGVVKPGVVKPGVVTKPGVVKPGVVKPGVVKPTKPGVVVKPTLEKPLGKPTLQTPPEELTTLGQPPIVEDEIVIARPDGYQYDPPFHTGHDGDGYDDHYHDDGGYDHGYHFPGYNHHIQCGGGYRWDSAALIIYDAFGHGYDNYHQQCFYDDSIFIVPHYDDQFHGTYHCHGGVYYYHPQTYATVGVDYVALEPVVCEFGGYAHCVDLASRLEVHCNLLCLDLYYNYRHIDGFQEYYTSCFQLLDAARFISDNQGAEYHEQYAEYLEDMDYIIWELQELSLAWEPQEVRQVSELNVESQVSQANAMLQHLLYDVGIESTLAEAPEYEEPEIEELDFAPSPDVLFEQDTDG